MFDATRCDRCGDCLVRCPELALEREQARVEIGRLVDGDPDALVLRRCASCLSCNGYCPHDCKPYDLILQRWHERYQRVGSPALWRFVCPTEGTNLWSAMHALLPPPARATVEAWMGAAPARTILVPGSYFQLVPEVLDGSRLLAGVTTMALPGHWECGAYLYQGGYLDVVRRIGQLVREDFDRWGVERVIFGTGAVQTLCSELHPAATGVRFDQELIDLNAWILQRIEAGELNVTERLGGTVTVHDNCYAKAGGEPAFERPRQLLAHAGVAVTEMRHHRGDALCCGFGRGAGWERNARIPFDILQGAARRIREAEETGADTLVTYCAGCLWLLLAARELIASPIRVVHLLELVRASLGERVAFRRTERAWDILAAMTLQIARGVGRPNFRIGEVKADLDPAAWRDRPQHALRALRRALATEPGRAAFRASFRGLERLVSRRP